MRTRPMVRIVSSGLVSAAVALFASCPAWAAEKTPKESPAIAAARKQVEAALQAEIAGDNDQRATLLGYAIQTAPASPQANWQLSNVHIGGKWLTLAEAEQHAKSDPLLTEYRKHRSEACEDPKAVRGLARWCLNKGLEDVARLHYSQLLSRSDVDADARQEAIRRMDLHNVSGTWLTGEQVKAREE